MRFYSAGHGIGGINDSEQPRLHAQPNGGVQGRGLTSLARPHRGLRCRRGWGNLFNSFQSPTSSAAFKGTPASEGASISEKASAIAGSAIVAELASTPGATVSRFVRGPAARNALHHAWPADFRSQRIAD
jgi:hypothetical protein